VKTEKIILADLFERPRRYLIPLFQRGYVWTKEDQWAPLWEDIRDQVTVLRHAKLSGSKSPRKHFLGAIVLQQQTLGVRHAPVSDVIDGQQRLMTLQVLLLAFRDVVGPLQNEFLTTTLRRLTENPPPHVEDIETFKVWPTSAFREDFRALAEASSRDDVLSAFPLRKEGRKWIPRPQLAEAYLFFHDVIGTFLSEGEAPTEDGPLTEFRSARAEELLEAITRFVQLVEINLDIEDDAQIIFETLNARGAPLSPSDLIRNFVFLYATRHEDDVVHLYEAYWRHFDETPDLNKKSRTKRFWREEERQGRLRVNRLDLFMFHYLTFQTEAELKLGHIFPAFREWWERPQAGESVDAQLHSLLRSANVFTSLLVPDPSTRLGAFAKRLKALDVTTVYPLLLFLCANRGSISDDEFSGILQDLESYLVRRLIVGLTVKSYNRVFLGLIRQLRAAGPLARTTLRSALTSLEGDSSLWPDDPSFEKAFLSLPAYSRIGPARTALVLESLEETSATAKQEQFTIISSISVEHVWPQTPKSGEWPTDSLKPDGTLDILAYARRRQLIEGFGNLTLVTPSFNSSLSNSSYALKQPALIKESRLRLNAYFQDISPEEGWSEERIVKRGEYLFSLARTAWPHP
jgi:hypothetical protein